VSASCAGVRFRSAGRIYYFDAAGFEDLAVSERVVVETNRGLDLGSVALAPGQVVDVALDGLKPILRRATDAEQTELARLRLREPEALQTARQRIAEHELPIKAFLAEYNFDGSRLTIYFGSEERRVDFRDLVRDLARALRTRVILHQVGPRDQAKLIGGIDRCGRELCCTSWMTEFEPISIKMAKTQRLPLNPAEISGVCGKLLCCLAFEDEQYRDMSDGLPRVGARMTSAVGSGRVVDVNVLARRITIQWETGGRVEVDADELAEQQARRTQAFPDGAP
jgi:cell fate regulator YaaT (PSP1 superfamily)